LDNSALTKEKIVEALRKIVDDKRLVWLIIEVLKCKILFKRKKRLVTTKTPKNSHV
jgi:hypothetical protein